VLPARKVLLEHWTDESTIELLLLTHPHADHYVGIDRLLEDARLSPGIRRVGCVCEYLASEESLSSEMRAAFDMVDIDDAEAQMELGRARAVLERIGEEWTKHPERCFRAKAGETFQVGPTTVQVLSPSSEEARTFFTEPNLSRRIRDHANDLSVVLELRYGKTVVLLGGDLPATRGGKVVPSGWHSVAKRATSPLNAHALYKVAHHGSMEAIHNPVVRSTGSTRLWAATPYNKGERLPDFADGGGVATLHGHEPTGIALTGMPVSHERQGKMPDTIARSEVVPSAITVPGLRGIVARSSGRPKAPPEECYWVFELDDQGNVVGRRRGDAATLVLPG
jgi:hypothetical protein